MPRARLLRLLPALAALGLPVGAAGCGEGARADVTGTIKLHGQPPKFTGIEVLFVHPNGTQVSAPVHEDGTYKAEGVPPGQVGVCFVYITPEAAQMGAEAQAGGGGRKLGKPGDAPAPKVKARGSPGPKTNPVPEPLREASTSKLTVNVPSGKSTTFDYDIK
jgi:hypothetical protein